MQYKSKIWNRSRLKSAFTAAVLACASACTPDGDIIFGPVRVTATVGEASFAQTLFGGVKGATITHRQRFCEMPTEEELSEQLKGEGAFDITQFIRLNRLELVETTLTATSGNFNFLTDLTVRFVPKPGAGNAVVLGTASAPGGFNTEIVLIPEDDVDFLALIRANDASDSDACPKIEYEMTFQSIPLQDVEYRLDVTVDGYVELGAEKFLATADFVQ
ncbi:MAG TPA: hypothetical protein PLJ47_19085 [Candidatus Hydrogenedentes bacterium]|nr:hypothetical protein [Candidatus Hydrogenedentota bacterium]